PALQAGGQGFDPPSLHSSGKTSQKWLVFSFNGHMKLKVYCDGYFLVACWERAKNETKQPGAKVLVIRMSGREKK
ncbi:MAG: hypothetical protein EBZ87_05030, partial [Microbacteriaceae bacterium]|nr:hypothetical protein [Microbacteriaceae bacterium]